MEVAVEPTKFQSCIFPESPEKPKTMLFELAPLPSSKIRAQVLAASA